MSREEANRLSNLIIGKAIAVHRELGPGLLESAYEACLVYELQLSPKDRVRQFKKIMTFDSVILVSGYSHKQLPVHSSFPPAKIPTIQQQLQQSSQ